jgi:phosphatidylglycerol:prolipoprotein diacylglycerol transferase
LVTGIAGARLSHVLENWSVYTSSARPAWDNFVDAINIRSGGLTFYGGFLLAFPCTLAYGLYKKVPVKRGMDIVAPCLMIGLGFGRIGCFLNGCCEGGQCNLSAPLGLHFPYGTNPYQRQLGDGTLDPSQMPPEGTWGLGLDGQTRVALTKDEIKTKYAADPASRDALLAAVAPLHSNAVHAAQLYSTLTAWLIALLLVGYYTLPHAPGRVFAMMLMIESPSRFLLEMLRAEPSFVGPHSPGHALGFLPMDLSFSMFVSVWLFLLGVVLWFGFRAAPDDMTQPRIPAGRLAMG